jgi:hypothetical protein
MPIYYPPQSSVYQTPPMTAFYQPYLYPPHNIPATPNFIASRPNHSAWGTQTPVLPPAFPAQHSQQGTPIGYPHPEWSHTANRPYHSAAGPPSSKNA